MTGGTEQQAAPASRSTRAAIHPDDPERVKALKRAIQVAGGTTAFVRQIKAHLQSGTFSRATVHYWLKHWTLIDEAYWPSIEYVTEMQVTRRQLRPDLWPRG